MVKTRSLKHLEQKTYNPDYYTPARISIQMLKEKSKVLQTKPERGNSAPLNPALQQC